MMGGELTVYSALAMKFQNCVHANIYIELLSMTKNRVDLVFQSSKDRLKFST